MKVLFVCLGNICRSPLAQVILQDCFLQRNISGTVDSCGTSKEHAGGPADSRSIKVAQKYGLDLLPHISKQFSTEFFTLFDWIFPMDTSNKKNLLLLDPTHKFTSKIRLFREFDPQISVQSPSDVDVPDPYYGAEDKFEFIYQMLLRSSIAFCDHLQKEATMS